jgi:hypothetical protein
MVSHEVRPDEVSHRQIERGEIRARHGIDPGASGSQYSRLLFALRGIERVDVYPFVDVGAGGEGEGEAESQKNGLELSAAASAFAGSFFDRGYTFQRPRTGQKVGCFHGFHFGCGSFTKTGRICLRIIGPDSALLHLGEIADFRFEIADC